MQKKLLAVAVAGALAIPGVAFAESSVTISGKFMATFGQYKAGNHAAGGTNSSENVIRDESSRIIFEVREDLGGGLMAIGKFDLRATVDAGTVTNAGESYVGLQSKNWGTLTLGRHDLHYGNHGSAVGVHAGLQANPVAVFDVNAGTTGAPGSTAVANRTRQPNVVRYGSPKFGDMFEIVGAYSTDAETDFNAATRKGSAFTFTPKVWGKNWEAAYSYWSQKPDSTTTKVRGDSLYGWYKFGGLKFGLAWNKSKTNSGTATTSDRSVWGIPVHFNTGKHNIYVDYYRAGSEKAARFAGADTKARFFGVTYGYDLSKRTTAAISYNRITNGAAATYGLFTAQQAIAAGEDPRFLGVTLQHRY